MSSGGMVRLLPLFVVGLCGHIGVSILFPVVPLYADSFGASVAIVGLVVGVSSYVSALTMIPFGILSDRVGRRVIMVVGLLTSILAPLLYIVVSTPFQLILVRGIHGLAAASFIPPANALVVDMSPPERRGEALGWFTTAIMVGFIIGPISGGFLLNSFGFDAAFYACSVSALIGLLFILPWLRGMPEKPVSVGVGESSWSWLWQRRAVGGLLTVLFIVFGSGTIVAFTPLYEGTMGITASQAGIIITAMYGSSALLRAPAGILSDKIGREMVILCGFIISAAAIACFSFLTSFPLLMVAGIVFGFGMGLAVTASFALVADLASMNARGLAMGAANSSLQAGLAIGATAMGGVAAVAGFESMFGVCGAVLAAGLMVVFFLVRRGSR